MGARTTIARETWKPTCREHLEDLLSVFHIRMDRCQRKANHNGRCVGHFLVWDKDGVAQLRYEIKEAGLT